MKVYIGYDEREDAACRVAEKSMIQNSSIPLEITRLEIGSLSANGLVNRVVDKRDGKYDLVSNAPCATDFSNSRFVTPILAQSGFALFIDCDMLVLGDVAELFASADHSKAVMVVKHDMGDVSGTKMDGCKQIAYRRKNWSSVMLFNCGHPANKRLSLWDVNNRPGRDLHAFYWLADQEIGELDAKWNWLVDVQPRPKEVGIAHFTLGTPDMVGVSDSEIVERWRGYL